MFSIVIPTYNRLPNLKLALAALDAQKNAPEFEVIVSDDGSTDGTEGWILHNGDFRDFRIIYQWCGPNLGFRTSRTRNLGIAQANYEHIILIDSDVMLNPDALHHHALLRNAHKDLVVVGLYHWANNSPLVPIQVVEDFENVMNLVPDTISPGPPNPGLDARAEGFHETFDDKNIITEYDGLGFFSGNISWPTKLWWELGGQDEMMPTGMGEDAELGQRMRVHRIPVLQYAPIFGVHYHHERDIAWRQKAVQKSIAYIDEKYGIGTYDEATDPETDPREKNLSVWYTRKQHAQLVKKVDDPTIFAVDGTEKYYVGIPAPFWIELLGFSMKRDVKLVADDYFDDKENMGNIKK